MNKKKEVIPGEMVDIDVEFVSLVRKGANRQKVQIYKADDTDYDTEEVRGFMEHIKKFFKITKADDESVAESNKTKPKKQTSFAQSIAVSDIMDSMWRVNDTLRDVMRNIIADEEITDKKAAMSQAIDDFATYMKDKINAVSVAKSAKFFEDEEPAAVTKAGRMLSGKATSAIKNAIAALQGLLSEAGVDGDGDDGKKGEGNPVKKEDVELMKSALEEVLAPITARIAKLENTDGVTTEDEPTGGDQEPTSTKPDDVSDVIKSAVAEAVAPLSERLDKVEKARGVGRNLDDEPPTTGVEKSADVFDGFFA